MTREKVTIDGNTGVATVAHALNEVIAIYPITPSSSMGELVDALSAKGETNMWGTVPGVTEMQSEAGTAGAWTLFRYDPRLKAEGRNPLQFDSKEPTLPLEDYMYAENRFRMLKQTNPERASMLLEAAKKDVAKRFKMYQQWAEMD